MDTRQTNLTRFLLFFPEKRTFFLDASDIFAFGSGINGESLLPFFSRRIGLVEGQQVPILAGLKTTGRMGQTNFGGLVVRTRAEDVVAPASTMGVRERTAFGFKVDYPNDLWDCAAIYRRIGDGFDPSLGFVPRRGINTYYAGGFRTGTSRRSGSPGR